MELFTKKLPLITWWKGKVGMKKMRELLIILVVACGVVLAVTACRIGKEEVVDSQANESEENKSSDRKSVPAYRGGGEIEAFNSFEMSKSKYSIISGATQEDFKEYTTLLAKEGYECFYETSKNGNLFETWTDGYNILTLSHIAYVDVATTDYKTESLGNVSYMSIAVDNVENSALPAREEKVEKITEVQITSVGTVCGYILRLADGRFIVFDGGMPEQSRTIYDILQSQNEREGNPVIAAWFLTHGHTDHIGALLQFIERYQDRVEIETFVHNLPAYEIYNEKNTAEKKPEVESENLHYQSEMYYSKIEAFCPDSEIIVAHAGQRFEYGDMDIDVLFTTENIYKKQMYDTNMSSVVYSITGSSGRMIILGDAQDIQCPTINAIYGEELKCDIIQVAHHGYNGGNAAMYASMNPQYAIWPNSYEEVMKRGLHMTSMYSRNTFNYKTVTYNLIPTISGENIILREGMTQEDLEKYDAKLTDSVQN